MDLLRKQRDKRDKQMKCNRCETELEREIDLCSTCRELCIRCGVVLISEVAIETGICPECWTEADDQPKSIPDIGDSNARQSAFYQARQ